MIYSEKVYQKAREIISAKRREAEITASKNYESFCTVCPEAIQIEKALRQTGSRAAVSVIKGGSVKDELTALKNINLELQKKMHELLTYHNLTEQDINPNYACKKCNDTAFVNGFMCDCFKATLKQVCYDELNSSTPLTVSDFAHFSLSYFNDYSTSDKKLMENIFMYCKKYAADFTLNSPSLLFQGNTGLGKTHLSLAIAKEVIGKGYGVIYGSVHGFAVSFEKERFSENQGTSDLISNCELLVLDDLGTEMNSAYALSILYDVINTRMMKNLPTIISTNLTIAEMEKKYNNRFVSRIIGNCKRLGFVGRDIRQQKIFGAK